VLRAEDGFGTLDTTFTAPITLAILSGTGASGAGLDGTTTLAVEKLRLTDSKFIMSMPLSGEMAMDYAIENGVIYVGGQPSQMCFTIDGMGVISNKGLVGIEGTYIRQVTAE